MGRGSLGRALHGRDPRSARRPKAVSKCASSRRYMTAGALRGGGSGHRQPAGRPSATVRVVPPRQQCRQHLRDRPWPCHRQAIGRPAWRPHRVGQCTRQGQPLHGRHPHRTGAGNGMKILIAEDRPGIHPPFPRRPGRRRDHPGDHRAGAQLQPVGGCRGRGNAGPCGSPVGDGLPLFPGLSLQQADAGGGEHRLADGPARKRHSGLSGDQRGQGPQP